MTYTVHTVRWRRGWELHIDGVGVTQVLRRSIPKATLQVRDYLWCEERPDWDTAEVVIVPT